MENNIKQISRNETAEREIIEKVRTWLSKPRQGIYVHVSDLLFPRKSYFRTTEPQQPTDEEVGYFSAGRAHHGLIEALIGERIYREQEIVSQGIIGTVDFLKDMPIEIKTTRSMKISAESELSEHYITQLGYYCSMVNSHKGRLLIFYLGVVEKTLEGRRNVPRFRIYDVEFEDLEKIRKDMVNRRDLLETALKEKNPTILPKCPDWMCRSCYYSTKCLEKGEGE